MPEKFHAKAKVPFLRGGRREGEPVVIHPSADVKEGVAVAARKGE